MKVQPIRLKDALEVINRKDPRGKGLPFQVSFYTTSKKPEEFKRVSLPIARRTIVPAQHRANKSLIGVCPEQAGRHVYSVHIRLIVELNNQPVVP